MLATVDKIQLIGPRPDLDVTLAALRRLGLVEIVDVTSEPQLLLAPQPDRSDTVSLGQLLTHLRARRELVTSHDAEERDGFDAVDLPALRAQLDELDPQLDAAADALTHLHAELDTLPRYAESLRRLVPLVPSLAHVEGHQTVALLLDAGHAGVLGILHDALTEQLGSGFELVAARLDTGTYGCVLTYPCARNAEVHDLLGHEHVTHVPVPAGYERLGIENAVRAMERRIAELPDEIAATQRSISDLVTPHAGHWAAAERWLVGQLEQHAAATSAGATRHAFVLHAWVPRRDLDRVRAAIDDTVALEILPGRDQSSDAPVVLDNPGPVRPFEFLVGFLAHPRPGTIDPSVLMALFLPMLFGVMVGDVVYGAALLVISMVVLRRTRGTPGVTADLARVLRAGAVWAIGFGVLFGEYLGDLAIRNGLEAPWFYRGDDDALTPLLVFTVAIGAAHITLGFLLGAWAEWRQRHLKGLAEKVASLVALTALFTLAGAISGALPDGLSTPAVAGLVVALVVLMSLHGALGVIMGPLELLGTFGNVLSYLRLAAVGLASVYLAKVANDLAVAVGPIWLGVLIAALLHTLNLALAAFSPMIQALRLHYVEFFTKFYDGGGRPLRPFGAATDRPTT